MRSFESIFRALPHGLTTRHFQMRYGPYRLETGSLRGYRGQRGMSLITAYADGLKAGFESLRDHVFQKTRPVLPIRVAIFHLPDFSAGHSNEPGTIHSSTGAKIFLSNRSHETSVQARADRARSEATHEVCHVFQFHNRPPMDDLKHPSWAWISEAAAVYSEQFVHRGGVESCFYSQEWLDSPDVPLDHQSYPSGMFVRWYAGKFGAGAVGEIWESSRRGDTPLDVIDRARGPLDALFTEYARDAYFLCDPSSHCFFPDVHFLWGFREVRERFLLSPDNGGCFEGHLDHLAADYLEVRVSSAVTGVECELRGCAPGILALRAHIAVVQHSLHRGQSAELALDGGTAKLNLVDPGGIDHLVVIVSNGSRDHDRVPYRLTVTSLS